jgi:hypothetical protein
MFNFLFLLPQLMGIGQDVARCLDGGMTEDEYKQLLDDLLALVEKVPALGGMMAIIQSVIKVARVAFPLVQELKNVKTANVDPASPAVIKMGAAKKEIDKVLTKDDLARADRSLKLLTDLSIKMASDKGIAQDPKTKKVIDTAAIFDRTS